MSVFLTKNPVVNVTAYHIGSEPPSNPFRGMVWFDTNYSPARVKFYNGTNWVDVSVNESDKVDGYHASQVPAPNTVVVSGATGVIDDRWLPATVARKTVSPVTIYVDNVNGSDTAGDGSASNPYRTFARALRDVGEFYDANVTIVLKASNVSYGNLDISGITRRNVNSVLTIQGEMIVLDSGVVVGFSNAVDDPVYGSSVQVAKITTNKTFQPDQYKHKLLRVYKGGTSYYRIITNNDTNSIYCSYTFPVTFDETWNWEILDWGTIVSGISYFDSTNHVKIFGLNIQTVNDMRGVFLKDAGYYGMEMICCRIGILQSQVLPAVETNKSCIALSTCLIDGNNNSKIGTGLVRLIGNGGIVLVNGSIFINCSSTVFMTSPDYGIINFFNGSRIYRGSVNPERSVFLICGCFNSWLANGKSVIDCGNYGIWVEGNGLARGLIGLHFGPNVVYPAYSALGGVEWRFLGNFLGVNVGDYHALHSRLQVQGSVATQVTTVSANTTLGVNHHIVLVDASGGNRTITLPDASTCAGRQYVIKKIDSSANTVTISAQAGQTIDGQNSVVLNTQYQTVTVVSDGNNWYRISG